MKNTNEIEFKFSWIILPLIFLIIIISIFSSLYTISAGERGVVLTWGKPSDYTVSEGLHLKVPFAQRIIVVDIKTHKYEADASSASRDLQTVSTKITLNYKVEEGSVVELYKTVGLSYEDRLIQPSVQEVVKASTAQFTAEELITRRPEVKDEISRALKERFLSRGIIIEEVSITNFDFGASFNSAIEAKVTAEQEALASKNRLEQVKYEAEQRVAKAEAEATAIRIQAEAIQYQGGKEYVQLQAINKWNGQLPNYMMTKDGVIPFLSVGSVSTPAQ